MASNGGGGGFHVNTGVRLDNSGDVFQSIIDGAKQAVDRVTKGIGNDLKESAYAFGKGDFNSFGNSIINSAGRGVTAGQWDPNLETGTERKSGEEARGKEAADADFAIATNIAKETDRQRRITNVLEASARYRMNSPGSTATSIIPMGANSGANTLLTIRNGR